MIEQEYIKNAIGCLNLLLIYPQIYVRFIIDSSTIVRLGKNATLQFKLDLS